MKLTKDIRREKVRKKFLRYLDRLDAGQYSGCNGRIYYRGLSAPQTGRPRNYNKRKRH